MNKDQFQKEVSEQCAHLREQAAQLNKLVESLQMVTRSDVSFGTIDEAKKAMENVKSSEIKQSLDKTFKVLKARAAQRLKEA